MLEQKFFARPARELAMALLGKVVRVKWGTLWLGMQIVETEAYYRCEKASHASLGYTPKRRALFMPAGTIYMYHSRGGDSLNISAEGEGDAVLIKGGIPALDLSNAALRGMQTLNPHPSSQTLRPRERLCAGQSLLCKALGLTRARWDQQQFNAEEFYLEDISYRPREMIITHRLGIPPGRDEHLLLRFVDAAYARSATKFPHAYRAQAFFDVIQHPT